MQLDGRGIGRTACRTSTCTARLQINNGLRSPPWIIGTQAEEHLPGRLHVSRQAGGMLGGDMDVAKVALEPIVRIDGVGPGRTEDEVDGADRLVQVVGDPSRACTMAARDRSHPGLHATIDRRRRPAGRRAPNSGSPPPAASAPAGGRATAPPTWSLSCRPARRRRRGAPRAMPSALAAVAVQIQERWSRGS
jgi:hypothetical protein